jgi:hypothetical protein
MAAAGYRNVSSDDVDGRRAAVACKMAPGPPSTAPPTWCRVKSRDLLFHCKLAKFLFLGSTVFQLKTLAVTSVNFSDMGCGSSVPASGPAGDAALAAKVTFPEFKEWYLKLLLREGLHVGP